jgi:hypothetical protein
MEYSEAYHPQRFKSYAKGRQELNAYESVVAVNESSISISDHFEDSAACRPPNPFAAVSCILYGGSLPRKSAWLMRISLILSCMSIVEGEKEVALFAQDVQIFEFHDDYESFLPG